jgi:hypothetical protein
MYKVFPTIANRADRSYGPSPPSHRPCHAWHGNRVTSAHPDDVGVSADGNASAPPPGRLRCAAGGQHLSIARVCVLRAPPLRKAAGLPPPLIFYYVVTARPPPPLTPFGTVTSHFSEVAISYSPAMHRSSVMSPYSMQPKADGEAIYLYIERIFLHFIEINDKPILPHYSIFTKDWL